MSGHLSTQVKWCVYWRRDAKSAWMEYALEHSEHNGRGALLEALSRYPHYEVELRKITTTEERVDD